MEESKEQSLTFISLRQFSEMMGVSVRSIHYAISACENLLDDDAIQRRGGRAGTFIREDAVEILSDYLDKSSLYQLRLENALLTKENERLKGRIDELEQKLEFLRYRAEELRIFELFTDSLMLLRQHPDRMSMSSSVFLKRIYTGIAAILDNQNGQPEYQYWPNAPTSELIPNGEPNVNADTHDSCDLKNSADDELLYRTLWPEEDHDQY